MIHLSAFGRRYVLETALPEGANRFRFRCRVTTLADENDPLSPYSESRDPAHASARTFYYTLAELINHFEEI
jgi:hypothetical protein